MAQKILSQRSLRRLARKRAYFFSFGGSLSGSSSESEEDVSLNLSRPAQLAEVSEGSEGIQLEYNSDIVTNEEQERNGLFISSSEENGENEVAGYQPNHATPGNNDSGAGYNVLPQENNIPVESDFSLDNDAEDNDYDLLTNLREWVVKSDTPHMHVNSLLGILRHFFPNLPKDARTLLATPRESKPDNLAGGEYYHFGIINGLTTKFEHFPDLIADKVNLKINIDGLPIFKSCNDQFWPILGLLENDKTAEPFVIGLWLGKSKPNSVDAYLQNFIEEIQSIDQLGFTFNGRNIDVCIYNFICDAPAKAFIKQTKGHTGYHGCDKCTEGGIWLNNRMAFPELRASLRTDDTFAQKFDEDHHIGHCPLQDIGIKLVSQFPADPMHLVYLGVVKKMIILMMKGPLAVRISHTMVNSISEALINFQPYLPREFARKSRSLSDVDRWKATEFRSFVLFTGAVAFKGVISIETYNNFMMLHVAINILVGDQISEELCNYAENLLVSFVENFADIYGEDRVSFNVHGLIHLANDVRKFGSLSNFSAFPFENFLQTIKRMIRKPKYPLQQAVRRLAENKGFLKKDTIHTPQLQKQHFDGPLQANMQHYSQFKILNCANNSVRTTQGDNVVLVEESVFFVRNVVSKDGDVSLLCNRFSTRLPFFDFPVNSLELKIAVVGNIDPALVLIPFTERIVKGLVLPYRNKFVCFPLRYFQ